MHGKSWDLHKFRTSDYQGNQTLHEKVHQGVGFAGRHLVNHIPPFPFIASKMDPPTRPTTRAKNANQHPGKIGQIRVRRTKAEIEHDKAVLREKKQAEEQKTNEGIARVAQLEDKMALDEADAGSAHPRSRAGILLSFASYGKPLIRKKIFAKDQELNRYQMMGTNAPSKSACPGWQELPDRPIVGLFLKVSQNLQRNRRGRGETGWK
jgi:hypothetical protein